MKAVGYGIGIALFALPRFAVRTLVVIGKVAAMLAIPIAARALKLATRPPRTPRPTPQEVATIDVQLDAEQPMVDAGPATVMVTSAFEVADRIVSIRLDPPVGVINLRIYNQQAVVKRDLIVSEPCLRTLMKGRRHTLPDVPYDRVAGLDQIKDETIEAVEKLINEVGNRAVRASRPRKDDFVRSKPMPQPVEAAAEAAKEEPARTPLVPEVPKGDPPMTSVVKPKVTTGFTYVGQLVKAGSERVTPKGRAPYEVFEATLQLDNGAELALRGAELERELSANGCNVGQRVAITPMGKVPVTLGNGSEGSKNLYRVARMDAPKKG
jgi:hypothetical protein